MGSGVSEQEEGDLCSPGESRPRRTLARAGSLPVGQGLQWGTARGKGDEETRGAGEGAVNSAVESAVKSKGKGGGLLQRRGAPVKPLDVSEDPCLWGESEDVLTPLNSHRRPPQVRPGASARQPPTSAAQTGVA